MQTYLTPLGRNRELAGTALLQLRRTAEQRSDYTYLVNNGAGLKREIGKRAAVRTPQHAFFVVRFKDVHIG